MPLSIPALQPATYVLLPQRLIGTLRDTPQALGLYSLIARLYLISHAPIPLSTPDVQRYDPTLSRGAVLRAIERLVRHGWLIETRRTGRKTLYLPTWGLVKGTPRPWRIDAPLLDRPRHVHALRLDRRLFDLCMGKLTPAADTTALITRYVTEPLLSLRDVGTYALTLAGLPTTETAALTQLQLVRAGVAQPLPADADLLAPASQDALEVGGTALTLQGVRIFGPLPFASALRATAPTAQPLFFVPPDLIGTLIGSMIAQPSQDPTSNTAAQCGQSASSSSLSGITWSLKDQKDHGTPPPTPPQRRLRGGGIHPGADTVPSRAELPDTEVARLLHTLNVRPRQVAELADVPLDLVRAAIADGRSRPYVRDLAGWVVAMVRDARNQGWRIAPPVAPPSDAHAAALRASFAQLYGEGLADAGDDERASDDERRVAAGLIVGAHTDTSPAGAVAGAASAPAPTLADADAEPHETLTVQLQRELRVRTYPDLHPLIARLTLRQVGDTLIIGCGRASDLPLVQARLLPLLGPILRLMEITSIRSLTVSVRATQQPPSKTKDDCYDITTTNRAAPVDPHGRLVPDHLARPDV